MLTRILRYLGSPCTSAKFLRKSLARAERDIHKQIRWGRDRQRGKAEREMPNSPTAKRSTEWRSTGDSPLSAVKSRLFVAMRARAKEGRMLSTCVPDSARRGGSMTANSFGGKTAPPRLLAGKGRVPEGCGPQRNSP